MIMCLPFMVNPSITAMSSLNDQYGPMSLCRRSLISGHPAIIIFLIAATVHHVSFPTVYAGSIYTQGHLLRSALHLCLCSCHAWLYPCFPHGCVRTANLQYIISGPGLYSILAMYWFILRGIH